MIVNTLERLAILAIGIVSVVFVYGMLSMAWAGCDEAVKPYHYQLYCGPTPEHVVHGCGYYKTMAECKAAVRPDMGYTKCVREENQEHN